MSCVRVVVTASTLSKVVRAELRCPEAERDADCSGLVVELTGEADCRGAAAVRRIRELKADCFVIAVSSGHAVAVTQQAVRLRIDDFFQLPEESLDFRAAVAARLAGKETAPRSARGQDVLRGTSSQMESLRRYVDRVSLSDSSVLITGETGTGKELVAQTLHQQGSRREGPFVSVNSAALPDTLFESEMFGFERGAFTGAHARHAGKLRLAHRGTIFFDEIGDIGLSSQAKLLRALETREVLPLGGSRSSPVDARVIAATNRDLENMTEAGLFRSDLFYRLNVVRIEIPPLRERPEDIPELLRHFLEVYNRKSGRNAYFDANAVALLETYEFPGNVRELRNVIESSVVNASVDRVTVLDLPQRLRRRQERVAPNPRDDLLRALNATNWNISRAASQLQCSRMTIYRKLAEFKLSRATTSS